MMGVLAVIMADLPCRESVEPTSMSKRSDHHIRLGILYYCFIDGQLVLAKKSSRSRASRSWRLVQPTRRSQIIKSRRARRCSEACIHQDEVSGHHS